MAAASIGDSLMKEKMKYGPLAYFSIGCLPLPFLVLQDVNLGHMLKILEVHEKLLQLKSPLGSKDSPARSCLDLLLEDAEISDGI